ncbi:MAG: hypothetical protein HPY82_06130 [Gammaproteobacteria bacterium]|nr:hypothetical protein [Gammaproteobacteria bacterium]
MNTPARKLTKSAVKNIVRFPPIKANGGKTILVESLLESKYCLHLEFDPSVETYFPQPRTFNIPIGDDEKIYTPDFGVRYVSGALKYVEVKPLERIQSAHYQGLFSCFEASLENTGADFLLVDESEIYCQPLLSNYEKLYQFRKRPSLNMKNLHQCAEGVSLSMPLSHLVSKLGDKINLREIYSWLAFGYLRFDINAEHLTMKTEVRFDVC